MSQRIHIGDAVRKRLEELEIKFTEFANMMSWTESKVYRQLTNHSWNTDELHRAGEVLGHNFFQLYDQQTKPKKSFVLGVLVCVEALESDVGRRLAMEELHDRLTEEE